jgi:triacylglycerol lipase
MAVAIDRELAILTVNASIEAYYAYDDHDPPSCRLAGVTAPDGYDVVGCWSGVDPAFSWFTQVECFGVVFRSQATPSAYVFAFRGTYTMFDAFEDAAFWHQDPFVPHTGGLLRPSPKVASGFWSIYASSYGSTPSMQSQLFTLLDRFQSSDTPIDRLIVTGHSLGAALSQLFSLDLALSRYGDIATVNYNYAGPRVGDPAFAAVYDERAGPTVRVQNSYDLVPCGPPESWGYQHAGQQYLLAFYNRDAGWLDPRAKYYDHQALNYQAVLACAFASTDGVCVNDDLPVPTEAETLVSVRPDPATVCSLWSWDVPAP